MPKMNWTILLLGAIAPIGATVMVSSAIAQTTTISPQPNLVSGALERLPEYRDPSYYQGPDNDGTVNHDAPVIAPELDPVSTTNALQNLVDNYDVPLPQSNGAFDADAPLLRRDYITYNVAAFESLNTQISTQFTQNRETIANECFVLEITVDYLTGRVERLQEDMERIRHTKASSSNNSIRLMDNSSLSFLKNAEETIREDAPETRVETDSASYAYWFYTLDPEVIETILPNHQQPLTQGEFVGYLSPTLDGLNGMITRHINNHFQNIHEDVSIAEFQLNALFDHVARVRGQLETLANVKHLDVSIVKPQNKVTHKLSNVIAQELSAQRSSIENFPDVPSSDPLYEALERAVSHGLAFPPPNHYVNPHTIRSVGSIYPDEALTIGDFVYYQQQWVKRSFELVSHSSPLYHLELACSSEFATDFKQETATMETTLQTMETDLQQLMDNR